MKNKILYSIIVGLIVGCMLFILTGCENNNQNTLVINNINELADFHLISKGTPVNNSIQNNETNTTIIENQTQSGGYWYLNTKLTLRSGASNNGATVVFSSPNSKGIPTKVSISGAANVDGHSIDGTYSLSTTECNEEAVFGKMSGNADDYVVGLMASSIKGELYNSSGKTLLVDIYF